MNPTYRPLDLIKTRVKETRRKYDKQFKVCPYQYETKESKAYWDRWHEMTEFLTYMEHMLALYDSFDKCITRPLNALYRDFGQGKEQRSRLTKKQQKDFDKVLGIINGFTYDMFVGNAPGRMFLIPKPDSRPNKRKNKNGKENTKK